MLPERLPDIPGWMGDADRRWLHDFAVSIRARRIVEIGVYCGRTTWALAMAAFQTGGVVFAVDAWHELPAEHGHLGGAAALLTCAKMLTDSGLIDQARLVCARSLDVAATFPGRAELVFIDANHEAYALHRDLAAWFDIGNHVVGHDWHMESVRSAVTAFAAERACHVQRPIGNLWRLVA